MKTMLSAIPEYLVLIPGAVLCYLPMKNQLKLNPLKIGALFTAVLVPCVFFFAWLTSFLQMETNVVMVPLLVLCFYAYYRTLKTDLSRSFTVFVSVCTLMTFPSQFASAFDALRNPTGSVSQFSVEAALLQMFLSCLIVALLAYPTLKYISWLIDNLAHPKIWYSMLFFSSMFLVFQFLVIPHQYATLHVGQVFRAFLTAQLVTLILLLFMHMFFYRMAVILTEFAKMEERTYFMEMQANQYQALQNYIRQNRQLRHDFRHSVHILSSLAKQEDLASLKTYLNKYEEELNVDSPKYFCTNAALNALFNYYDETAQAAGVATVWQLEIPNTLTVSELDLASLFGNLMENAIAGCQTVPEERRSFSLSAELKHGNCLFIVSTNTFDGRVRKNQDGYLSTKRHGKGTGLVSIMTVAEKYNGSVRVSNTQEEFFVDVMLKV